MKKIRQHGRLLQALPSSRILPRLKAPKKLADNLCDIALAAHKAAGGAIEEGSEPLAVIFASVRAETAANHFVSEKAFETPLPQLRRAIARGGKDSLTSAVEKLLQKMPPNVSPPFPQMKSLFCSGDPTPDWGPADEIDISNLAREDLWEKQMSPQIVRAALTRWLELLTDLRSRTGQGRTPITAERNFVALLSEYWTNELKAPLSDYRYPAANAEEFFGQKEHEQKGSFANFVRQASQIIPRAYRPSAGWDHAIREIVEK